MKTPYIAAYVEPKVTPSNVTSAMNLVTVLADSGGYIYPSARQRMT